MNKGRLGSWEAEPRGLGQGGVETYQQFLRSQDRGPEAQRQDSARAEITSSILDSRAGAANVRKFIPGQFLKQHPQLKRFLKKAGNLQGISQFGILTPPTDAEITAAEEEVGRLGEALHDAMVAAFHNMCTVQGNRVPAMVCNPSLNEAFVRAQENLANAGKRLEELQRRKEAAASTPEEAAAVRAEIQSVQAAQADLATAQDDVARASMAMAQAAASGDPAAIAEAANNLNTAAVRTETAASGVEAAAGAARKKKIMMIVAAVAGVLILGFAAYKLI